ncbi:MAG: iron-sulfur cluster assembly protein [archaeon]|nr:iron-sulfur cluster assembly protein [archaeon]MCP8314651.1 iron-sulfur cluster assembly protein [archaeon]MCP8317721.1 iron-sulfur cluster assembly protein [archaeon]MCP8319773.1 iron-sulfur cluster assembly protein [archaeon]
MVTEEEVMEELSNVIDPEIGLSIIDMGLVDEVKIEGDKVSVSFHLTAPFCPPVFATMIAKDIKDRLSRMAGVKSSEVKLVGHIMADQINEVINKPLRE